MPMRMMARIPRPTATMRHCPSRANPTDETATRTMGVAAVAYARDGDRLLLAISLGILLVVVVGIGSALTATV